MRRVLTIAREVVATDQAKEQWKRNLAISLSKVGEARAEGQGPAKARSPPSRRASPSASKLAETDENNLPMQAEIATALERIGDLKRDGGRQGGGAGRLCREHGRRAGRSADAMLES